MEGKQRGNGEETMVFIAMPVRDQGGSNAREINGIASREFGEEQVTCGGDVTFLFSFSFLLLNV